MLSVSVHNFHSIWYRFAENADWRVTSSCDALATLCGVWPQFLFNKFDIRGLRGQDSLNEAHRCVERGFDHGGLSNRTRSHSGGPGAVHCLVEGRLVEVILVGFEQPEFMVGELRLRVSKWEFGGEGECGAVRWAAAEPTVGGSWHGRGSEGKRAHDEVCGAGPERGSEDGSKAQAGEHVAGGARGQANNRTCPRGGGAGGARAPWRIRAMASASASTSRTRMRQPHFRQRVMSMAKTRARSCAHAMRRGRGEELGEEAAGSLGRAMSSASCGGGGAAGLGMTCSRRRWWLASGAALQ